MSLIEDYKTILKYEGIFNWKYFEIKIDEKGKASIPRAELFRGMRKVKEIASELNVNEANDLKRVYVESNSIQIKDIDKKTIEKFLNLGLIELNTIYPLTLTEYGLAVVGYTIKSLKKGEC